MATRSTPGRPLRWPRDTNRAIAMQIDLRRRLSTAERRFRVRHVAGADVAYDPRRDLMFAAVLVFTYPDLEPVEVRSVKTRIRFPYVPGLLSFREAPALVKAFRRLRTAPDLLICDGQGIAHPRGFGLASHLGLAVGVPTIGCAKSRLVGDHGPVGELAGSSTSLLYGGRVVGAVVRSRTGIRPLYVSPGNLIGLSGAVHYVLACCRGLRLPEPVRQADLHVARLKRSDRGGGTLPRNAAHAAMIGLSRGVGHEGIARDATICQVASHLDIGRVRGPRVRGAGRRRRRAHPGRKRKRPLRPRPTGDDSRAD